MRGKFGFWFFLQFLRENEFYEYFRLKNELYRHADWQVHSEQG